MFSINLSDKNITYSEQPASGEGVYNFSTLAAFTNVADNQKLSRQDMEEVWNGFAGVVPFADSKLVKKFRNRPYGLRQIWNAIQRLAPEGERAPAKEEAEVKKQKAVKAPKVKAEKPAKAPKAKKANKSSAAKPRVPKAAKERKVREPRTDTKREEVIRLISRANGASLAEIMEKMQWLSHTTRGFLSTLRSKHGIAMTTTRHPKKGTIYKAA